MMQQRLEKILAGEIEPNIFPFLWLHGEEETVLRHYMDVIYRANIRAVCLESRPHPDFLGEGWWHDLDILLDEAEARGMKVWILDDKHFPTGYANGALQNADPSLCRQFLTRTIVYGSDYPLHPTPWKPGEREGGLRPERFFDDDRILATVAREDGTTAVLHLTRNRGPHRNYINMADEASVRVLLDTVYEPHYARYADKFGTTIAGFFSDEPEIGNDHLYEFGKRLWELDDLPWSTEIEATLRARWQEAFDRNLSLLWEPETGGQARVDYMDVLTRCVQRCFSQQLGNWCRSRGVEYIGHIIEDNNQHTRTGSSLGHYFRGLWGQDMAGIDDIGFQVLPQGEWNGGFGPRNRYRDGEFYHYALGKLASSLAALDPKKKGRAMCEIFGYYRWAEGVRLEKYLVDHFLVRGINRFVPHAFSPKAFPDPDCPPHFYAHGHNPQYRHFGALMAYTGRLASLFDGGHRDVQAAILYNAEAEWSGEYLDLQKAAIPLWDNRIDYDFVPEDAFLPDSGYCLPEYELYIIPGSGRLEASTIDALLRLKESGKEVWCLERRPMNCSAGAAFPVVTCQSMGALAAGIIKRRVRLEPENDRIRVMHYDNAYFLVNEGATVYRGSITFPEAETPVVYNAWDNRIEPYEEAVEIHPRKSLCVLFGVKVHPQQAVLVPAGCSQWELPEIWQRSLCLSEHYPDFGSPAAVRLPDRVEKEFPAFSGFVRYTQRFSLPAGTWTLEITDAGECTELFLNGRSLGIQIVPPFLYRFSLLVPQEIELRIETASTLERAMAEDSSVITALTGISGTVRLYRVNYEGDFLGYYKRDAGALAL